MIVNHSVIYDAFLNYWHELDRQIEIARTSTRPIIPMPIFEQIIKKLNEDISRGLHAPGSPLPLLELGHLILYTSYEPSPTNQDLGIVRGHQTNFNATIALTLPRDAYYSLSAEELDRQVGPAYSVTDRTLLYFGLQHLRDHLAPAPAIEPNVDLAHALERGKLAFGN